LAFLDIINLSKQFEGRQVLNNLNIKIDQGEIFSILGPSGSGKTTLLRIIAGLEHPDAGQIVLNGQNITNLSPQKRNIGIVFQNYALFPHMTVFENIAYGLVIKKIPKNTIKRKVDEILEKLFLSEKKDQNVALLSGGEQQRVSLARVIVLEFHLILFDEPLSNLDHLIRLEARHELTRLQEDSNITSIYVTHDQSEALSLSDQIAVINKGTLMQMGKPKEIYFNPANEFSARFVGHYNLLNNEDSFSILGYKIGNEEKLAVLPEHFLIHKSDSPSDIFIQEIFFTGPYIEYILIYKGSIIKVISVTLSNEEFRVKENVVLSVNPENIKVLSK
jgi:ABC-type Fe3+/spermidine/putrescine transport system ATPase subunit